MSDAPNARIIGKSLEDLLDQTVHEAYRRAGQADIWHQGTVCIPTRRGWQPIESRPDYSGLLIGSGQHVEFDAKHCLERRYRHSTKRLHQLRILWNVHQKGGIAGILVANLEADAAWWLRPRPEWAREEFQSTVLGLEPWSIPVPCHTAFWSFVPDWLPVAVEAAREAIR